MTDNVFASNFLADIHPVPSYNRSLLYAVGLALSFAVLAVSAALAWDQMSLVIDNVQRRDYVQQLDALKNNQRRLVYSLDQTARLHSRLLVEQHRSNVCDADIVFPGELNAAGSGFPHDPKKGMRITTTLDDTGCASRFHRLRRLSHSLAVSIHSFWNYPEINSYTFNLEGTFLAQSHDLAGPPTLRGHTAQEQIAIATAPLRAGVQRLRRTVHKPALPFLTGLHPSHADTADVLSVGVPIYRKETLVAITAIDIERSVFSRVFLQGGRMPGFFVFDTSRAVPVILNDITADERPLVQSVVKHWLAINTVTQDMSATKIGHRFYFAETIGATPWVAVYSFSFTDIFLASESLWMWIGFSMFGALLLLWSGIYLINRHMLVAEAMLRQARHSADEANAAKSMFLATISHEIRTPLHGAMGNLELLEKTPLSPSQHSTIDTINRAFFSLLQIINNVLDLSKAGASQLHLSSDVFDPASLLEEVARTFAPCIAKKKVQFFCLPDYRLPKRLVGDAIRLRQVFNNLLSNAVKFTSDGKIVLRAEMKESTAGYCRFTVQISDSGIGISEQDQKKLFMPFQQANKTIAGTFGGTGLGLSLARNLCEAMGGTIEVESREHEGASFTVALNLPIAGIEEIDDSHASAPLPDLALAGVVIALCCEDRSWRCHLRLQLEAAGAIVLSEEGECNNVATTAAEAQSGSRRASCDTVLIACQDNEVSLNLPRLANHPQARQVMVTPLGPLPPEWQDNCIRVSALSQSGLLSAADPRFEVSPMRSHASGETSGAMPSRSQMTATPSLTPSLNILLVDDDLTNVALAQQQLAMLGYNRIDLANNGLDALEKCRERTYQLVLTDQFMPGMDGNLLAATLRKKSYPARIVMITASRPSPEDRRNLDAVLLKPASLDQLKNALSSHCTPSPIPIPIPPSAPIPAAGSAAISSSQTILWNAFLQDYENTVDTLEQAAGAGERLKCLEQLHKLKGALEILRQPLAKKVATLERRSKTEAFDDLAHAYRVLRQALDKLIAERNGVE